MKKLMALGSVALLSFSVLAGCQIQVGEETDTDITGKPMKENTAKNKWVKTGNEIPDTDLEFAGYGAKLDHIAIRYFEDGVSKTDMYRIFNNTIESNGFAVTFGETDGDGNRIEVLKVKEITK